MVSKKISFCLTYCDVFTERPAVHGNAREHSECFFDAAFEIFELLCIGHCNGSIRRPKNVVQFIAHFFLQNSTKFHRNTSQFN